MAVKNHELDKKIRDAALKEFMNNGYQKASIYKICDAAGVTTGAIYTRYTSKDDLFKSLVLEALQKIKSRLSPIKEAYLTAGAIRTKEALLEAIRYEEEMYLEVLFEYYNECVLFVCKSEGSSVGEMINDMFDARIRSTVSYFKSLARKDINYNGVGIVMKAQFYCYNQILIRGYSKEEAISCMNTAKMFLDAGWEKLFDEIL